MANILRPGDWENVPYESFGVIVSDLSDSTYECILVLASEFFGGLGHHSKIISRCPLIRYETNLWIGYFRSIDVAGSYVIKIVDTAVKVDVFCQGVVIGKSTNTQICRIGDAVSLPNLHYPLPVIRTSFSNFNSVGSITVEMTEIKHEESLAVSFERYAFSYKIIYPSCDNDALHSMMLESCIGNERSIFREQLASSSWIAGAGYIALFTEATVYLRAGAIIDRRGIWNDSTFAGLLCDEKLMHYPDMFKYAGNYGRLNTHKATAPSVGCPIFLLSNVGIGNFGHWMLNCLLSAFLLADYVKDTGGKFLVPRIASFARESLRLLGLEDYLLETDEQFFQCDRLVFASPLSTHANMYPSKAAVDLRNSLKAGAVRDPLFARISKPKFIYMTRLGFSSGRKMANEQQFIARLAQIGFVTIATHELSMLEKVAAFSEAEIIISQMGASLTHMLFVPTGCVVVEITTDRFHSNEFWYLASLLELSYVRFMLPENEGLFVSSNQFEFDVPVEQAIRVVLDIQARSGK